MGVRTGLALTVNNPADNVQLALHDGLFDSATVRPYFSSQLTKHIGVTANMDRFQQEAFEMSIALANSGDLQIEFIEQKNDAPSMYKEFLDAGHEVVALARADLDIALQHRPPELLNVDEATWARITDAWDKRRTAYRTDKKQAAE